MFDVEYLVIAVLNEYRFNSGGKEMVGKDYQEVRTFLETLYISNRLKLPLKGILLIGYWKSCIMEIPLTWLDDLSRDEINADIMYVRVGIEDNNDVKYVSFPVSLSYMGLRWDEMDFSKDLQRDMNMFYTENRRIPTPDEYKELTEMHLYAA